MLMCCLSCAKADKCEQADRVEDYCINHEERPMTNSDRIRQMTDEELAMWIADAIYPECFCCPADCDGWDGECPDNPEKLLGWLKSPVEVDDGQTS